MGSQQSSAWTPSSLLVRVCADDKDVAQKGWRKLIEWSGPLVYHWCRKAGLGEADRADVFQEVYLAAWRNIRLFRRDRPGDSFRGWLRTITRNKIADHFRHNPRLGTLLGSVEDAAGPAGEDEPDLLTILLHRAVEAIRGDFEESTFQAFWLTSYEERSAAEVAELLKMNANAVRQAKYRVRIRLEEEFERLREEFGDLID